MLSSPLAEPDAPRSEAPPRSDRRPLVLRDAAIERSAANGGAARFLDARLRHLARRESRCRLSLGKLLDSFRARRAYQELGFVRLADYARERLGCSASEAETAARVAARLEALPAVARAFDRGEISWTKARILAAVASSATEERWLELARGSSTRRLEEMARAAPSAADEPRGAPSLAAEAEVRAIREDHDEEIDGEPRLRFAMRCPAAVWVLFRRVVELARRVAGEPLATWRAAEAIAAEGLSSRAGAAGRGGERRAGERFAARARVVGPAPGRRGDIFRRCAAGSRALARR
jgi:uncharacterized protein DUF222